jgi:hypothetical protein|tara:strand:- start:25373 stop:25936 length:564 start_codon:yes stop_codon:yes gene_type:complete
MAELKFKTAFKYPFNRAKGLLNILLIFLPIVGWFALGGYGVRIVKEFSKGKYKKLPVLKFGDDFKLGFFMFIKALPFVIAYAVLLGIVTKINPWARGLTQFFVGCFMVPMLSINFMNKQTVGSYFEFEVLKPVFDNLGDYVVALLKSLLLQVIFILMTIILIGLPAASFTKNIFLADFYRRRVKRKK